MEGAWRHGAIRSVRTPALALALAVALAGCASTSAPSATAAIRTTWTTFFSGASSASTKTKLLQDGTQFTTVLESLASSPLAKEASSTVDKVSDITPTTASVTYTIDLDGAAVLSDEVGMAVKQGGTWKVSDATFCVLLHVEQVAAPACAS